MCKKIDPLDRTSSTRSSMPIFAVSIAYAEKGEIMMSGDFG